MQKSSASFSWSHATVPAAPALPGTVASSLSLASGVDSLCHTVPFAALLAASEKEPRSLLPASLAQDPSLHEHLEHGQRVRAFAQRLFCDLALLHGLEPFWLTALLLAASLHDLGQVAGPKKHHKRSMQMILALDALPATLRPFVALIARYHRKSWPDATRHPLFAACSSAQQEALTCCAALIRIADGLDYSHCGSIAALSLLVTPSTVTLCCRPQKDCPQNDVALDASRALTKGDLFENLFKRTLLWQAY